MLKNIENKENTQQQETMKSKATNFYSLDVMIAKLEIQSTILQYLEQTPKRRVT